VVEVIAKSVGIMAILFFSGLFLCSFIMGVMNEGRGEDGNSERSDGQ